MSYDFNGTTTLLDGTFSGTAPFGPSLAATVWFNADTQGEGDAGRLMTFGAVEKAWLGWDAVAASKKLRFQANYATTNGIWAMTTGFTLLTGWKFIAVTLDSSNVANDPTVWLLEPDQGTGLQVLTVGSGLTEVSTPLGATAVTGGLLIGNNGAGSKTFDGRLGELATWNAVLSTEEIAAIAYIGALARPAAGQYLPLDTIGGVTNLRDYSGHALDALVTAAGVAAENPPVRPAGRRG